MHFKLNISIDNYCELVKKSEQYVLACKDAKASYLWAVSFQQNALITKHENIVLGSENPELNFKFAQNVYGANASAHGKVILESEDKKWINEFKKQFPSIYKKLIENTQNLTTEEQLANLLQ